MMNFTHVSQLEYEQRLVEESLCLMRPLLLCWGA